MNFKLKALIGALAGVALSLGSCSGHSAPDPVDTIGEAAENIVVCNPEEMAKSLGAKSVKDLSDIFEGSRYRQLVALSETYGVETSKAVLMSYPMGSYGVIGVKKRDQVEKSLKVQGLKSTDLGGMTIFAAKESLKYVIEDDYMWLIECEDDHAAVELVEMAKEAAQTPLPDWKHDLVDAGNTADILAQADSNYISVAARLDGPKCNLKAKYLDSEGQKAEFLKEGNYEYVGDWAKSLDENALLSVAIAKADVWPLVTLAMAGLDRDVSPLNLLVAKEMFEGPIYGSIGFDGQDPAEFDKIWANITLTSSSPFATGMLLLGIGSVIDDMDLPTSSTKQGFKVELDDAQVDVYTEGNAVKITTKYQPTAKPVNPASLSDCIGWAKLDMPKSLVAQLTTVHDFGLKGEIKIKNSEILVELEFTDTKSPFLANVKKISNF